MNRILIAPSILSADYARLGEELRSIASCGAEYAHVDVMDGHFVPNLTIGAPVVKSLRKASDLVLDCHLMVSRPADYIESFGKAGADIFTFHIESEGDPLTLIREIKKAGMKPAVSLKPGTPPEAVYPYLSALSMVLVMTVEPGFGGQSFQSAMLPKIQAVRAEILRLGCTCDIQVDGGIVPETAALCREAGANVLVSGSYLFGAADRAGAIASLRGE